MTDIFVMAEHCWTQQCVSSCYHTSPVRTSSSQQSVGRQAWFLMLQEQINGLTYCDPNWHVAKILLDFWTSPPDDVPIERCSPVVCKGRAEKVFTYALFSLWHCQYLKYERHLILLIFKCIACYPVTSNEYGLRKLSKNSLWDDSSRCAYDTKHRYSSVEHN